MGLKMKNVYIIGVHQFYGRGVTKNNLYEELPKKGGLDNLQGAWQKIGRRAFLRGGLYLMRTMT